MQKQGENILDFTFKASEKKFALHCNGLGIRDSTLEEQ